MKKYLQIVKIIAERIRAGEYPPDRPLPPQQELCREFETSRSFLHRVLAILETRGLVTRGRGRGTLVKPPPRRPVLLFVLFPSTPGYPISQEGNPGTLYNGIDRFATEHDCDLIIQSGDNFMRNGGQVNSGVDGIIIGGTEVDKQLEKLAHIKIPIVVIGPYHTLKYDTFSADYCEIGYRAAEAAVRREFRRPLFTLYAPDGRAVPVGPERVAGAPRSPAFDKPGPAGYSIPPTISFGETIMEYRTIGRTGISAGVVGLGTEYLDGKPYNLVEETILAALDGGVNLMDLFMPGDEVRGNIGKALKGRRDRVLIQGHIGSVDLREQYDVSRDLAVCKRYFEQLLRCLDTDYIDFGMLFFVDSDEDYAAAFESEILAYAQELKQKGVIRAIGAGSHRPATARRIVESGAVDLLMFSINPAFDLMPEVDDLEVMVGEMAKSATGTDPVRADLYRRCEQLGVGITVMKTLGAGKLLSPEHTPFAQPLTVGQCIHYALTRPGVVSTLVGCASAREVETALGYLTLSAEERDYAPVIGSRQHDFRGNCVYCNHCLPCPAQIDIAAVNRYLDIARLDPDHIPPGTRHHYLALPHHASECISCGNCEKRCPFSVPVIRRLTEAARLFGR